MTIGTRNLTQSSRSCWSRSFERCTIRFTANGAALRPGWVLSQAASAEVICSSHSCSREAGRAFSEGNAPTTPLVHCAITRSGLEIMNNGAPMTGTDSRLCKIPGSDMVTPWLDVTYTSTIADYYARGKYQRTAKRHLQGRTDRGGVHVAPAYPGNHPKLDHHDAERDDQGKMQV